MKNLTSAQLADHIHVRYLYKIKTFPMLPDGYCYFQSLCDAKIKRKSRNGAVWEGKVISALNGRHGNDKKKIPASFWETITRGDDCERGTLTGRKSN